MKLLAAAAVLAACGSGEQPLRFFPPPKLAPAFGSGAALEKLIGSSITLGGLWFADPACQEFSSPQQVIAPRTKALARCLAGLPFVESKRRDALEDVVVLTYAPGFEIEARVIADPDGGRMTWIGFEAERDAKDTAPTISAATFESLRTAGDKNGGLEPAVVDVLVGELPSTIKLRAAMAWFKVCIDAAGNITNAEPRLVSSVGARDGFLAAINAWQFKPFVTAGKPLVVCAMTRLVAPADREPPVEALPFPAPAREGSEPLLVPEGTLKHFSGDQKIVPTDINKWKLAEVGVRNIWGTFRICVDRKGNVESVFPFSPTGVPDYDRQIELSVRGWTYEPYRDAAGPVPACTAQTFTYVQTRAPQVIRSPR